MIYKKIIPTLLLLTLEYTFDKLIMHSQYEDMVFNIQQSKMNVNNIFSFISYILLIVKFNLTIFSHKVKKGDELKYSINHGLIEIFIFYLFIHLKLASIFDEWSITKMLINILGSTFIYFICTYLGLKYINNCDTKLKL